jgi:hypothetical protein
MILGALRRFALMYGAIGASTVLLSLAFGALSGASLPRSIAIGLYLVGSVILIFAFFVGNRGPLRHDYGDGGLSFFPRGVRRVTPEERRDTINVSVLFVALGFGLILLGVASDPAHRLL